MTCLRLTAAAFVAAILPGICPAAFSLHDVQFWTGTQNPRAHQALLVIDWDDGLAPLAWGFRWLPSDSPTGADMLRAVLSEDPRLQIAGVDEGLVSHFSLDTNLDGNPERFRPGWDGVSRFWYYFVNNEVYFDPEDFTKNGHVVPPATEVVPLGNPYDAGDPGPWNFSSTGTLDRPLADGSWDGYLYGDGSRPPGEPVAAIPIPEPSTFLFVLAILTVALVRRRSPGLPRAIRAAPFVLALAASFPFLLTSHARAANPPLDAADPAIEAWATSVADFQPGPVAASDPASPLVSFGSPGYALGAADAEPDNPYPVVSLGDGGAITLSFAHPVADGPGPDFAVFENGFASLFLELAFVEVSSDGVSFRRFPAIQNEVSNRQIGTFGTVDPRSLENFAGLHPAGLGTTFDLSVLGLSYASFVRIVDVVGSLNPAYASFDSAGNPVNDPFPTPYHSGGFDLDAVAVLHEATPGLLAYLQWFDYMKSGTAPDSGVSLLPGSDPDRDGRSNLSEYAFGGHPLQSGDPGAFAPEVDPLTFELNFPRRLDSPGLRYTLELSAGLDVWIPVAEFDGDTPSEGWKLLQEASPTYPGVSVEEEPSATGFAAVRTIVLPAPPYLFFRVRVALTGS